VQFAQQNFEFFSLIRSVIRSGPVQSGLVRSSLVRSGPVRSDPGFVNAGLLWPAP